MASAVSATPRRKKRSHPPTVLPHGTEPIVGLGAVAFEVWLMYKSGRCKRIEDTPVPISSPGSKSAVILSVHLLLTSYG